MATTTKNYSIGPQDGWTPIATAGWDPFSTNSELARTLTLIRSMCSQARVSRRLRTSTGVKVCHKRFWLTTAVADASSYWIRVTTPVSSSPANNGKLRLDVLTVGGTLV